MNGNQLDSDREGTNERESFILSVLSEKQTARYVSLQLMKCRHHNV